MRICIKNIVFRPHIHNPLHTYHWRLQQPTTTTPPTVVTKYMDFSQMTTTTVAYKYQWVANKRQTRFHFDNDNTDYKFRILSFSKRMYLMMSLFSGVIAIATKVCNHGDRLIWHWLTNLTTLYDTI